MDGEKNNMSDVMNYTNASDLILDLVVNQTPESVYSNRR